MHAGRLSVLMLLLSGCLWLSPGPPVLAQAIKVPTALPKILEFDRKFCPICQASERVNPDRQEPVFRPVRGGKTLHRRGGCGVPPV
jgi:hypothetical protein